MDVDFELALTVRLVFPIIMHPASRSCIATGASSLALEPFKASDPAVVPMPNVGVQIISWNSRLLLTGRFGNHG